ncbi:ATP synthase subunit I [Rhodoferax sediminis]|jgi:ATP synthase protein I|uniref:ATP synthase subunit I n=1 Tax=Rhodoferax sediminis TaxID=2509614 RepID=A0A515DG41_9BURK|nr:ATP synthase subunit I [Rhodoferax sediminis]QDL39360.1 ATP synthase subunit I [Rhodoferax sediminis]
MSIIAAVPEDDVAGADFKPLTPEQARQLRAKSPSLSPWWVVVGQVVVGALVALAAWALTGRQHVGWSAGYGALAVVIPAALFARGLASRVSSVSAGAAVFGFFLWEAVKIALTVAMLFAAPRLVTDLSWPAMLVGLVVTMKVYWVALVWRPKRRT